MNPRERWQALQSHLSAARGALADGDRVSALQHIEAALAIDPEFLAARMLLDRVNSRDPEIPPFDFAQDGAERGRSTVVSATPFDLDALPLVDAPPPTSAAPVPTLSSETLANFEDRIKQRVRDREAAAAEQALVARDRRPVAAQLAAAAVFLTAISSAAVYEPKLLLSRNLVAPSRLIEPIAPEPLADGDLVQAAAAVPPRSSIPSAPTAVAVTAMVDAPPEPVRAPSRLSTPPIQNAPRPAPASVQPAQSQPAPVQSASTPAVELQQAPVPPRTVQMLPPRPLSDSVNASNVVTPTTPAAVPAVLVSNIDERARVDQTLQLYRRAYNRLDARQAQAVYPAVNASALAHAFESLESQMLSFDSCDFDVQGQVAAVTCHGTSEYVPKFGSHVRRVESRVWNFTLRKDGSDWKIEAARAGR